MVGSSSIRAFPLALALAAAMALGCSSNDDDGINNDPGPDDIRGDGGSGGTAGAGGTAGSNGTGIIGPEGGVITGEQGVTVTIPAGALDSETTIAVTVVEASGLPARPRGVTAAGPFVALTPHGTQFAAPIEVALPYTSTSRSLSVLRIDDENDTTWEMLTGASFEDGTATINLAHFSILTVAATDTGGAGGSGGSTLDSDLIGVYGVDSYQASPLDACDQLSEVSPAPEMLVLYPFVPQSQMDQTWMGGAFCQSVDGCRNIARDAPAPTVGYSFIQGNDRHGWLGFGIVGQSASADQCLVELQAHELTATGDSISIRTDAVDVVFPPEIDGDQATCRPADAIASFDPGLPCRYRLQLDATYAADLDGTGGSDGSGGTGGTGGVVGCVVPSFPDQPDLLGAPRFLLTTPAAQTSTIGQAQVAPGDPVEAEISVNAATHQVHVELANVWIPEVLDTADVATSGSAQTIDLVFQSDPDVSGRYYMRITLCGLDCQELEVVYETVDCEGQANEPCGVNVPYRRTVVENGDTVRVDSTCFTFGGVPGIGSGTVVIQ